MAVVDAPRKKCKEKMALFCFQRDAGNWSCGTPIVFGMKEDMKVEGILRLPRG